MSALDVAVVSEAIDQLATINMIVGGSLGGLLGWTLRGLLWRLFPQQ
jgi:hypothetical protein